MNTQHTPGPWMTQGYQDNGYNIGTEQGPTYKKVAWASSEANARLIAAAPTMYQALLALMQSRKVSSEEMRRTSYYKTVQQAFDIVEAIAEGKQ